MHVDKQSVNYILPTLCIPIVGNLIKLEFGDGRLFVCTKGYPFNSYCHFATIIITLVMIIVHDMLKI